VTRISTIVGPAVASAFGDWRCGSWTTTAAAAALIWCRAKRKCQWRHRATKNTTSNWR